LAKGVIKMMLWNKIKYFAAVFLPVVVVLVGGGLSGIINGHEKSEPTEKEEEKITEQPETQDKQKLKAWKREGNVDLARSINHASSRARGLSKL